METGAYYNTCYVAVSFSLAPVTHRTPRCPQAQRITVDGGNVYLNNLIRSDRCDRPPAARGAAHVRVDHTQIKSWQHPRGLT